MFEFHQCSWRSQIRLTVIGRLILALMLATPLVARAEIETWLDLYLDTFYLYADETEVEAAGDGERGEVGVKANPRLYTEFGDNWRSLIHAQMFYATDTVDLESDEGGLSSDGFIGLRELWVEWSGLTAYPGEAIRIGRHRLRYEPGLTLDTDITALRWLWDTTLLQASIGIGEKLGTFRSDDSELPASEENLQRYFADLRWQYRYQHFLSGHVFHTNGTEESLSRPTLTWLGLSLDNDYYNYRSQQNLYYYIGALAVTGEETPPGSLAAEDVSGWAADLGFRWRSSTPAGWQVGLHLAATDDDAQGFRQTGLHSNRSRFLGGRTRLHRFNEALRAELRNVSVGSVYFGLIPDGNWEINLVYSDLRLRNSQGLFVSDNVNLVTNGIDDGVGRGVDLVATWYWDKNNVAFLDDVELDTYTRLRLSGFELGDAFVGTEMNPRLYRATFDWVMRF